MQILNEILHFFLNIFFPLMIAENLPPRFFDLLLVEGNFSGGLAVPLH